MSEQRSLVDLSMLDRSWVEKLVNDMPQKWDVPAEAKHALADLICWRADFVKDYLVDAVGRAC